MTEATIPIPGRRMERWTRELLRLVGALDEVAKDLDGRMLVERLKLETARDDMTDLRAEILNEIDAATVDLLDTVYRRPSVRT